MSLNGLLRIGLIFAALLGALAGCGGPAAPESTPTDAPAPATATTPPTEAPTETPTEAPPEPTATPAGEPALPAAPQEIAFEAEDGQALAGTYYPAATNPAPVVVLMHWAPGDQNDWRAVAGWLQNRGGDYAPAGAGDPWLDPTWFPTLAEGFSVAVFTFTFRGCEGGCDGFAPQGWLLDAQAAMAQAAQLPGVDPERMVAVGASIGADGAADACQAGCLGALSLSPGGYLDVPYAEAVDRLGEQPAKPAWCLAAEGDAPSAEACRAAAGEHYRMEIYPGQAHGVQLIAPEMDPGTLELLLDFLGLTLDV
jgi:dienelactone hydrolase